MTEMANRMTVHMDEKPVYDILLEQDFSDGLFRVFFNGEEYTNLTDVLDVQEENELVIIRLIMMAGRLW